MGLLKRILSRPSSGAASFTPSDLPTLAVWFDGTDPATMTVDGSNRIASWVDKNGSGLALVQTTAGEKPTFDTGTGAVRFDGTDDKFTFSVATQLITVSTGWTMGWCGQNTLDQQFRALFGLETDGVNGGPAGYGFALGFSQLAGYTDLYFGAWNPGAGVNDVVGAHATVPSPSDPHAFVLQYNGSGATTLSNYSLRIDGAAATLASVPVIAGSIGTVGNDGNGFYKGYLMHWVQCESYLNGADTARLEEFLMAQVGV